MTQGYLLADTNSLVYAHRIGGTNLLDDFYKLAQIEQRLLAITRTVGDEIAKSHRGPELLNYIADKHIPIVPTPRTEQYLKAGSIPRKNAGEHSMTEVAAREHAQGRSTVVWSDDKFFASAQELQRAPGVRPVNSADMLDGTFHKGAIANDFAGEMRYRNYIEGYRAIPAIQNSARLNAFDPPAPGLRVRATEATTAEVAAAGGKLVIAAAVAAETYTTTREALQLLDRGNVTGAQSQLLHFGARASGGVMGAAVAGMAAGSALGPVAAVGASVVGGVAGAVGGDNFADALDHQHIRIQRGGDGNAWHLDDRPGHGWMRMSTDEGPGRGNMPMRPVYADARLADELNYKASTVSVELALARAPALRNPFSQPAEVLDEVVRPVIGANQPWTRDAQSHAWSRQATEAPTPMTHGMPVHRTVAATPEQTRQLDAAAKATIAHNIAHSPQGIAQQYQEAYEQRGWKQHGPVPAAVLNAIQAPPSQQPAVAHPTHQQIERIATHESRITPAPGGMSFAEAHKRRDEPEKISPGSLQPVGKPLKADRLHELTLLREVGIVNAKVKEEPTTTPSLHGVRQRSLERTHDRMHDPAPRRLPHEPAPAPALPRAAPVGPALRTDPRDPADPDHKDFQKICGVVAQNGRWDAQLSASIAAQALADFKAVPGSRRLDVVAMESDTRGQLKLFMGHAPWGGLQCLSMAVLDPVQAARAPVEQGFEQLAQMRQVVQQRELQQAHQQGQPQDTDQARQR